LLSLKGSPQHAPLAGRTSVYRNYRMHTVTNITE
jgi:hypothetical protein